MKERNRRQLIELDIDLPGLIENEDGCFVLRLKRDKIPGWRLLWCVQGHEGDRPAYCVKLLQQ